MDIGEFYHFIYVILVAIISVPVFKRYSEYTTSRLEEPVSSNNRACLFLTIAVILFIGFRPESPHFGDSQGYINGLVVYRGRTFSFDVDAENFLFDNLYAWIGCNGISWRVLFLLMATIYFGGLFYCCKELFPNDCMASYIIYLAGFSTFSYSVNGIKAGVAAVLFLIAIILRNKNRHLLSFLLLFISWGVHHSMIMPICAYVMCSFIKKPRIYMWIWLVSLVIAALHITFFQTFFAGYVDDKSAGYLLGSGDTIKLSVMGGFRIDFILYGCIPLLIGWYYSVYKQIELSESYLFVLNYYAIANALWLLCMYAEYNNRIAYLSWFIYPFLIVYPYLKEDLKSERQYNSFKIVAFGHLFFTLFMTFIYY